MYIWVLEFKGHVEAYYDIEDAQKSWAEQYGALSFEEMRLELFDDGYEEDSEGNAMIDDGYGTLKKVKLV